MASLRYRRRGPCAFACALFLFGGRAFAHHPANTARVGDGPVALGAELSAASPPSGSVLASSGYNWSYFGRSVRGKSADSESALGQAAIHTVSVRATWAMSDSWRASLLLPWGHSRLNAPDSPGESATGMGDLRIALSRVWGLSPAPGQRLQLLFRLGLSLPTGQYEPDRGLEIRQLDAGTEGQLIPTSYYSQVNLGLGAWATITSAQVLYAPSPRLQLAMRGHWSEPISTTEEDLHWGRDLAASVAVGLPLGSTLPRAGEETERAWLPEMALDYLRHTSNTMGGPDGTLQGGASRQMQARASLAVRWTSTTSCALGAELPLWQQASGLQLMKTVSSSLSCQWAVR